MNETGLGTDVLHLVIGPEDHGVVRFGRRLGELTGGPILALPHADQADPGRLAEHLHAGIRAVHLQYTDALYAPHTSAAAERFVLLRNRISAPVSVTLHDLPDPHDDPQRYRRRALSYARVAQSVDAVALSSRHELFLLSQLLGSPESSGPAPRHVIPLPLEQPHRLPVSERPTPAAEVAVFGFIYPGKGHDDVIRAMAGLPSTVSFTALGRTADGHDQLKESLATLARRSRRSIEVTGFVADVDLVPRLQRVAVPVAPARMISASGSINTWIAAGRRPLVAAGPYTREFDRRYPGSILLYRPAQLPELIQAVLVEPRLSWLEAPVPEELTGAAVGRAYAGLLGAVGVPAR